MSAPLRPVPRARLYERLVERLLEHVEAEGLRPGDRLPGERELAVRLGVSRASVSQALVALEVRGVVDVRHGDGAVLLEQGPDARVLAALRARRRALSEVIDAREALEVKLAELAAARRTDEDVARIRAALELMARDIDAGGRGLEGDERFHAAVTAAAHSGLLADLMTGLAQEVRASRQESLGQPGRPHDSLAGHTRIADAVEAGDPAAAAAAMREHIRLVSDVALLRGEPGA
ncbi:FadR/GntR family transcriptional regulator [Vallicoccus soli]|uniref:FadR/GntR family transcriptional regulator n=1 Tax=Vallicoccus soli TaxID=2339232 RepID=UPI001C49A447|nr:FadR/GntR family transcriptional regulator [Vallicoccus soli]